MSIRKVEEIFLNNIYQIKIQASQFVNISHKLDIPNVKVREYQITQVHIPYKIFGDRFAQNILEHISSNF